MYLKTIKLDQAKLLGFKILQQTPESAEKQDKVNKGKMIKEKIGGKIGGKNP